MSFVANPEQAAPAARMASAGDDHGNAPSSATLVALPSTTGGRIEASGDVDYFRFEILDPQRVAISTSSYFYDSAWSSFEPPIALYASDGRLLDSHNGGYFSRLERSLSAGTYYIRVATNDRSTGRYFLALWRDDHGSTLSSATRVALPSTTAGQINDKIDVDYFRFEVTRTQWVSITTSGDDFLTDGYLYDGDGDYLEAAVDSHWCYVGFSFALNLSAGTYYVGITSNSAEETGTYTLHLALSHTACGDDHGDTRSSATRVALPSTTTGQIETYYDKDLFRFEVAHEQRVSISILSDFTTYTSLSDGDRNLANTEDDAPLPYTTDRGIRLISMRTLPAGTYYVLVNGLWESHFGEYTLRLEVAPLYGDELRLPLDALAPDAPGELHWTAAHSSDESMASVRIEDGELVVEPAYAAEGPVRIEATATDGNGGTITAIFDVQVEFYSPPRTGAGWRSALLSVKRGIVPTGGTLNEPPVPRD